VRPDSPCGCGVGRAGVLRRALKTARARRSHEGRGRNEIGRCRFCTELGLGWAGASPPSLFHSAQSEQEVREEIYTGGVRPSGGSLVTGGEHPLSLAH
jgi:hypothetical protein